MTNSKVKFNIGDKVQVNLSQLNMNGVGATGIITKVIRTETKDFEKIEYAMSRDNDQFDTYITGTADIFIPQNEQPTAVPIKKELAKVSWQPEDVQDITQGDSRPDFTIEQAEAFLSQNDSTIVDAMTDAGRRAIWDLILDVPTCCLCGFAMDLIEGEDDSLQLWDGDAMCLKCKDKDDADYISCDECEKYVDYNEANSRGENMFCPSCDEMKDKGRY